MRSMARLSSVQKQLLRVVEALVRAVVEELCELEDVSVLKVKPGAGAGLQQDSTAIKVNAAVEKLTKDTVDQLSQLFCRLSQAKAPLSYLKRQKLRRKRVLVEAQLAKRRSSVQLRLSGVHIQTTATDTTNGDEGKGAIDLLSQTESLSGEMDPLLEDTAENISEEVLPQEVEVQQETILKVELEHEQEQVECSMQHCDQQEEAIHNQGKSAVKPISKEEDGTQNTCSQAISSETLEIKISAAQSFDVGHAQEVPVKRPPGRSLSEGGTRKKAAARNLIQCDACDKTFTYLNNLKRHQKTFHSGETPHACQDCGERFGSKRLLRVHLREHRVEKPHACKLCEKVFRLPNHLKKHMTSHTNERPFICSTCGKTFALVSTLRAHEKTHSDEKTFVCTECGMSFLTKSYLDYHQRVHTGEKPYTCMHCGKTFAQKSNLRVHERLHTGEKPFHCEDCGESFIHANSFKSHKQLHTGMKAFCCEHCGKGFRRGTHLKTHLLTHTGVKPFQCDLCPKTFALKGSLKAHRLTHTGEKSFVCNICNKTFTQASSLGKHKRTHTGEKPYLCTFCSKSFCQSSHLHYHYRAFHPGQTS
ncbi:gastrula zinc finger protein XlCGF57.1 [Astyanax mexicanus]|uniref:gastrula zinc finger protein XlCGF57.1 n=1 Tax=Astyanax mexicanus TaxID=7994 RepID=UPI0020CACEA5|nr:gastrula zinc finger protein XlCGF57.1 [Astyanax mexicanus]